jgi:DNA-binding NarL/FixJ family response regulator
VANQPIFAAGLQLLLDSRADLSVVACAHEPREALSVCSKLRPDIVLIVPSFGDDAVFALLTDLAGKALDARVVILAPNSIEADFCGRAIALGAVGIVYLEQFPEVLFRALKCVAEGEVWLERSLMATVLTQMSRSATTPARGATTSGARDVGQPATPISRLTPRELELIGLLGEGLKNKQIAERLFITELTVRNHLASIYSKLEVSNRLALAIYAYNNGLLDKLPE